MQTYCVFVIFVMMLMNMSVDGNRRQLRVHKGRDVSHEEYPYVMVLIANLTKVIPTQKSSKIIYKYFNNMTTVRICTCSLIKPSWVLIAAHCLTDLKSNFLKLSWLRVIYGDLTIPPNTTKCESKIQQVFTHPQYFQERFQVKNDIALLLIEPLDVKPLAKLSAVDYRSLIGYPVTYLGGGVTYNWSSIARNDLKSIKTFKEDQKRPLQLGEAVVVKCDPRIMVFGAVYPGICFVGKCSNPSQSEKGDSGGPLLFRGKIIGICSASGLIAPLQFKLPLRLLRMDLGPEGAVYTAVSPYLDWIYSVISTIH